MLHINFDISRQVYTLAWYSCDREMVYVQVEKSSAARNAHHVYSPRDVSSCRLATRGSEGMTSSYNDCTSSEVETSEKQPSSQRYPQQLSTVLTLTSHCSRQPPTYSGTPHPCQLIARHLGTLLSHSMATTSDVCLLTALPTCIQLTWVPYEGSVSDCSNYQRYLSRLSESSRSDQFEPDEPHNVLVCLCTGSILNCTVWLVCCFRHCSGYCVENGKKRLV